MKTAKCYCMYLIHYKEPAYESHSFENQITFVSLSVLIHYSLLNKIFILYLIHYKELFHKSDLFENQATHFVLFGFESL